jgi:hypothetical protein
VGTILAALLWAAAAHADTGLALRVVALGESLRFNVEGIAHTLKEGDQAYSLPVDRKAEVTSGSLTLLLHRTRIVADRGDAFTFVDTRKGIHLLVHKGQLEIRVPGSQARELPAGNFVRISEIL